MKNIQHVFFDLDHTLWDFEKNSDLAFQKVFIKHSISLSLEDFLTVYKPLNFNYWKLYREEKVTKEQLRYGRLKDSFEALDYRISDDLINEIAVNYLEFLPDFNYLFDGTFEILEYLKSKYQLHIITNGFEEVQTQKMLSSNIHHYFDKIITSESVGVKKPNPKVFNYALDLAKADKGNSIMIGDNLEADIEGAINVGMRAIYCNFENNTSSNSSVTSVTSLIEIKEYL
ncbi:YjjG family noncanonical pyrimidine nucleotidase [Polaribacter butkevichii]|uniref:Noncanonical pyrimidine nucleotidase, YjjG family n=1 Tax=Polaribacter butkevichii TaxID=218490 RepID=A0A2P6C9A8_9FLAO|nr:YjjG family noncanonical pyrimidine nucleotidase [Polaribacter butkevichii]PQJ69510.1 noncanonical pyrimidine nucleotidase, YjjG family [Polaribacter butkevichii]